MRINLDLSALWNEVGKISKDPVEFYLETRMEPRAPIDTELEEGKEITLDDVDFDGPVASVQGRQVLLYIPDHGIKLEQAEIDGREGNKFHVTYCRTLESMRAQNRFARYIATNDLSGDFKISGLRYGYREDTGLAKLMVCKNCLNRLNYKGASNSAQQRERIAVEFHIPEFFETYSSCFRYMPPGIANAEKSGYTEDWPEISRLVKQQAKYICQKCRVDLSAERRLLHVHHKNGVKSDNSRANLVALCVDCHRKEPQHEHMHVRHEHTQKINRLRREQGLNRSDWTGVEELADPAVLGLLGKLKSRHYKVPEIGYELMNDAGEVIGELEAAWPERKLGIVISEDNKFDASGWQLYSIGEFLRELA